MKKLFAMTALALLLLAGCAKEGTPEATPTTEPVKPDFSVEAGVGEAVVPEEGDIVIPIGE